MFLDFTQSNLILLTKTGHSQRVTAPVQTFVMLFSSHHFVGTSESTTPFAGSLLLKLVCLFAFSVVISDIALSPATCFAQGPENTLVVVNADSPDSLAVANCYINQRDIPATNVVYLEKIPRATTSRQSTSSSKFENKILRPIFDAMSQRGIENQIECITYSASFPTRINIKSQIDTHLEQTGKRSSKLLHAPWASITSITYFHRNAFGERPDFFDLKANNFANPQKMKVLANPFSKKDSSHFTAATEAVQAGNIDSAIRTLTKLAKTHPDQLSVIYSLARCHALKGNQKKALAGLQRVKEIGFASKSLLTSDEAFSELKNTPSFREIIDSMEDLPDGSSPSRSFSAGKFWAKNGWANGDAQQGERYILSSVLAIVEKNASTLEESLATLRSSAAVDGTNPNGDVYFADHKDVRSRVRKRQFESTKKELESLDRTAIIGSSITPLGNSNIVGATLDSSKIDWQKSGSRLVPGAICDNLTSYGGLWGKSFQTQLSEYLDAGAAGASGTICEPYAVAAKFPSARWHAHYARGCTLAESFFQSVAGPSQLLLGGDPLCCPFGKFPDFKITGIQDGGTVTRDFILKFPQQTKSPAIKHFEIFYDGVFLTTVVNTNKIKIATDATSDGFHEIRIVGVADSPIANRRSKKIGFVLQRNGHSISLNIGNPKGRLGTSLQAKVVSSVGNKIKIQQNSRTITTITNVASGNVFSIPTSSLGLGKTTLQAIATLPNGATVKSQPVSVSLVAP